VTDFNASSGTQVTAALVAGVLYAATYLSFVRLLRFPRNWHRPDVGESLVTVALAILMVALVSMTPDGIDGTAVVVSGSFVVVMFYIIAAPATAFLPTSRLIEFLAKHGNHAGLWLAGPALIAGLAVPNIKLQTVLATAMAIELTWLLRQRRAPGRHYRMTDRDLSVLNTQAQGDLAAFQQRHGIRELVLSDDAVRWDGCEKGSPPCPFNLYVNRLGLNTAPCCREHMKDLSHHIATYLKEMGVVHWLEGGSLLGAIREGGKLLDWEDDIDISVLLADDMTWRRLTTGLAERCARDGYYVDLFERTGFVSISFDQPKRWPFSWERNRLRGEIRADVAVYRKAISHGRAVIERRTHKGAMPTTELGGFGVPLEVVLPTSTAPFLGRDFACPNQAEAYLGMLYGDFRKIEYTYVDAAPAGARAPIDTTAPAPVRSSRAV